MNFNESYKNMVDHMKPSEELIKKIKKPEEGSKVKLRKTKFVALVAAACLTVGIAALAAGRLYSYEMSTNRDGAISDYDKAVEYAEKMGETLIAPREFSNGYCFELAMDTEIDGVDEEGNVIANGKGVASYYVKEGRPRVYIYADPILTSEETKAPEETRMVGDVMINFNHIIFKSVPTDYVLTQEDRENLEQHKYEISYGHDIIGFSDCITVCFEMDNKLYNMFSFDNDMTNDEWYTMAEEFIQQK